MMAVAQAVVPENDDKEDDDRKSSDIEALTKEEIKSNITASLTKYGVFDLEEDLKNLRSTSIFIGVIGSSSVGKSSFINNMLGIEEDDEGAAEIGDGDTTQEPKIYSNPQNGQLKFYDLPGFGTASFKRSDEYLKIIDIGRYDFFLILYDTVISTGECWIIKEVLALGKSVALVRTRADDMTNRIGKTLQECIEDVKEKAKKSLVRYKISNDVPIFVISNIQPEIGDFDKLFNFLRGPLTDTQRIALILQVKTLTETIIEQKKTLLLTRTWYVASSIGYSAGLPGFCKNDFQYVVQTKIALELQLYLRTFGLTSDLLKKFPPKIRECLTTANEVEKEGLIGYIHLNLMKAPVIVKEQVYREALNNMVPILGSVITGCTTYRYHVNFLRHTIQKLAADAKRLHKHQLEMVL